MTGLGRDRVLKLVVALGACLVPGCFGMTQNPTYFPHLSFMGDIIQTHAKPAGRSYFADYDPHAIRLEVRPLESTSPVRRQQVLIATVYDEKGLPRRGRRVEWILEGMGNIVEVDESGCLPGRGYKVDNKYAVSYTEYKERRITRGNKDPNDDFVIRPGQTWCVISSAVEGDTIVSAYAPEIHNWDNQRVFATQRWVDAEWQIPVPAVNRAGTEHQFVTRVFRHTDKQPLANYRVRYRIIDGPPAIFLPDRTQEATVISDLNGEARVSLVQVVPQPGINKIGIEIIRPPDPTAPSGVGIVIGRGETSKQWQAAQLSVSVTGPPAASVGQQVPYTITIANSGTVDAQAVTVRDPLRPELQFLNADPRPMIEGTQLIWTLGALPPGRSHIIQLTTQAVRPGRVANCVSVTTPEGIRDERCVETEITPAGGTAPTGPTAPMPSVPGAPEGPRPAPAPTPTTPATPPGVPPQPVQAGQMSLNLSDPQTAGVGVPVTFTASIANNGQAPITNLNITADFDNGLEHETKANPVEIKRDRLNPNDKLDLPLQLIPRRAGQWRVRVVATADGGLRAQVERILNVTQPQVALSIRGPKTLLVGQTANWEINIANTANVPLTNLVVRAPIPPQTSFQNAGEGRLVNNEAVWNLGNLPVGARHTLQLFTRGQQLVHEVRQSVTATADPGMQEQADASFEILGVPAFRMDVSKTGDPVDKNGKITYSVVVTNTGSLAVNGVALVATVTTPQLQIVKGNGPSLSIPQVTPGRISFPALDGLAPNQSFTYTVEAKGMQPGDATFHAELTTVTSPQPIVKEESTIVYDSSNGKTKPAAPGAAAPGAVIPNLPSPPR